MISWIYFVSKLSIFGKRANEIYKSRHRLLSVLCLILLQSLQRRCLRPETLHFYALLGPKYFRLLSLQLLMPFMKVLEC
jgi:hypothetical protein